jgi:hypothetical protein
MVPTHRASIADIFENLNRKIAMVGLSDFSHDGGHRRASLSLTKNKIEQPYIRNSSEQERTIMVFNSYNPCYIPSHVQEKGAQQIGTQ